MVPANGEEAEFWAGPAGGKWLAYEAEQDHFLSEVAALVIETADPRPGSRVLDIGCGTGALTMLAAEKVGATGRVLASDIAEPFTHRVAERASGLPQVGVFVGDAQFADWPEDDFDVAVSRFGVMFFSDPAAAFANISRALRPGGRMVFAAWGSTEANPYWQIPRDVIDRLIEPRPRPEPNVPGPMGLSDTGWAMARLRDAGLGDVDAAVCEVPLLHGGGAVGAADLATRIGPAAGALADAGAGANEVAAFREEVAKAFAGFENGGQARIPATIHLYTARKQ